MRVWQRLLSLTAVIIWPAIGSASQCIDVPSPPRTPYTSAADYATSPFGLDDNGILYRDYGRAYGGLGRFHNPYFIAQYAAALYRDFMGSGCQDSGLRQQFLLQSEWLLKNAVQRGEALVWTYPFRNEHYDLQPGWISGITQARVALVLLRASLLTGDDRFRVAADRAMFPYLTSLQDGGVVSNDDGVAWLEEAPHPTGKSFKILNGHITAIGNIKDYYELTHDQRWMELYERAIAAVRRDLSKFDAGFTSLYSLDSSRGRITAELGGGYNALHIEQLLWMYEETKDSIYLDYAALFRGYEKNADVYTAMGSINEKSHGPSQAKALYKSAYWVTPPFRPGFV